MNKYFHRIFSCCSQTCTHTKCPYKCTNLCVVVEVVIARSDLIYTQTRAAAKVRFSKITTIRWRPKEKNSTCLPPQARGQFGGKYLSRVPHWMITWLPSVTGYINKNIIRAKGSQWGAVKVRLLLKKGDGGRETNIGQELNRQKIPLNISSFLQHLGGHPHIRSICIHTEEHRSRVSSDWIYCNIRWYFGWH